MAGREDGHEQEGGAGDRRTGIARGEGLFRPRRSGHVFVMVGRGTLSRSLPAPLIPPYNCNNVTVCGEQGGYYIIMKEI